jgi:hypothetical protein
MLHWHNKLKKQCLGSHMLETDNDVMWEHSIIVVEGFCTDLAEEEIQTSMLQL